MSNVIHQLPDAVANQIAAGEVIQRPASVVKELMENAIDSGATLAHLIVKDAGKTLIQVIDNGCGMSPSDAKMCFARHATSKISSAHDLFALATKGFRGEALASICAIAHVELKTRQCDDELGVQIINEASEITLNEPTQTPVGTSISVKNIFFNVPARRKFLKSTNVESKHIIDEFQRVALIHPEVGFKLTNNGTEQFHLEQGNFKQRIVALFGKGYAEKLVPIEENTDIVKISGFIIKPEFSKKTRGEQFFFANDRFIKSSYLNHAVAQAMDELLPPNSYPSYFIKLSVDPGEIDINIHPTKTEVKFADEKAIYAILRASTKQSLNKYNVAPTLDFNQETTFNTTSKPTGFIEPPQIQVDPTFNPFDADKTTQEKSWSSGSSFKQGGGSAQSFNWEKLYETPALLKQENFDDLFGEIEYSEEKEVQKLGVEEPQKPKFYQQVHARYILTEIDGALLFIDQRRAHQRILYQFFADAMENQKVASQQLLFPETIELSVGDATLLKEVLPELQNMGIDINEFGANDFVVNGLPADLHELNATQLLEELLEQIKINSDQLKLDKRVLLAKSLSRNIAIPYGQILSVQEMESLVEQLFQCEMAQSAPNGKPTFFNFTPQEISDKLG